MSGYMGKVLRVNLTDGKTSTIDTGKYEDWGGGHGMGSAIFWDLCPNKAISGFDSQNVVTIMTSPLSGTLTPGAPGRTEVQGVGVQSYPTEWFTRSNFGGRFGAMLKYAGWDGVVIEGKAEKPVWIDIRNDDVQIRDAKGLWGLDTWETQEEIWSEVSGGKGGHAWWQMGVGRDQGRTTQKPAVLTIGPAGENLSRIAALVHDAGNGAGQGGFGGVWGSKNLKAISVIGTNSVPVADPNALMSARLWAQRNYGTDVKEPKTPLGEFAFGGPPTSGAALAGIPPGIPFRPQGCLGCHRSCRARFRDSSGNESSCVDFVFYNVYDANKHGHVTEVMLKAGELAQRMGVNNYPLLGGIIWLKNLHKKGVLGSEKIPYTLPFDQLGEVEFAKELIEQIAKRKGIGKDLAEGPPRAAKKWGRLEEDLQTGTLPFQYWGYPEHYDARTEVEWGYGTILGDRDINEHDFNWNVYWTPTINILHGQQPPVTAKELSEIVAEKCKPYNDPLMIDYSDEGIYSEHMAKTVAWHRHYTRFWKQSILYCDWCWADFVNPYDPDKKGLTPEGEPKFFNAVTGKNLSFEEGIEIGRKIWNLDRAIWVLQGRHRDQEVFADYTFQVPAQHKGTKYTTYEAPYVMPVHENGEWKYKKVGGRTLDKDKFEGWKTKYYKLEGWNPDTGWPTRGTLEDLGLKHVADELEQQNKLG